MKNLSEISNLYNSATFVYKFFIFTWNFVTEDKKFAFVPSMIYTYRYTVNVNTSFDGADAKASSGLKIDSEFELHFTTSCEGVLLVCWFNFRSKYF